MTTSAWIMLTVTWAVIIGCATRFFLAVVRNPGPADDGSDGLPDDD